MSDYPKRPVTSEPFVDQMDLIEKALVEIHNQPSSIYTINKRKQFNGRKFNTGNTTIYSNPQVNGQGSSPAVSQMPGQTTGQRQQYGQMSGQVQAQMQSQAHMQAQVRPQATQAQISQYSSVNPDLQYGDYNNVVVDQNGLGANDVYSGSLNGTYNPPPMIFEPMGHNDGMQSLSSNNVLTNYNQGQARMGPNIWGSSTGSQGFTNDATVWG